MKKTFLLLMTLGTLLVSCDRRQSEEELRNFYTIVPTKDAQSYIQMYADSPFKPNGIMLSYTEVSTLWANSPTEKAYYSIIFGAKSQNELVPLFRVYDSVAKTETYYELKNTVLCPPPGSCNLGFVPGTRQVSETDNPADKE